MVGEKNLRKFEKSNRGTSSTDFYPKQSEGDQR